MTGHPGRVVAIHAVLPDGHFLPYARELIDYGRAHDFETILITSAQVILSEEFKSHLSSEIYSDLCIVRVDVNEWPIKKVPYNCSHLIVVDGDRWLRRWEVLRWSRGITVALLVTRDPWLRRDGSRGRIADFVKRQAIRFLKIHPHVRPVPLGTLKDHFRLRPVAVDPFIGGVPTPSHEESCALRSDWGLDIGAVDVWIGMLGIVSARKGLDVAVEAILRLADTGVRPGLVLAGPPHRDFASFHSHSARLKAAGIPLRTADRILTNEEINALALEVDVLLAIRNLPYPNTSLNKAMGLGKPLVLSAPYQPTGDPGEPAFIKRTASKDPGILAGLIRDAVSLETASEVKADWRRLFAEPLFP